MHFARRVAPLGIASVGWLPASSGRLSVRRSLHFGCSICLLILAAIGVPLDTPTVAVVSCAAILLFGLPHGTFDVVLIQKAHAVRRTFKIIVLYLGFGAAMYALWRLIPTAALMIFLGLSIVHFAEDWSIALPPLFAHGIAAAVLTAPVFLHQGALTALFALLIGVQPATILGALVMLIAPISMAIALVGIVALWRDENRDHACATCLALLSMIVLPPIVGFALFFCLLHSPVQFGAALRSLAWNRMRQWAPVAGPLTCAALGIAVLIFTTLAKVTMTDAVIVTAFMTLSVLTLPHLVVPVVIAALDRHYGQRSV